MSRVAAKREPHGGPASSKSSSSDEDRRTSPRRGRALSRWRCSLSRGSFSSSSEDGGARACSTPGREGPAAAVSSSKAAALPGCGPASSTCIASGAAPPKCGEEEAAPGRGGAGGGSQLNGRASPYSPSVAPPHGLGAGAKLSPGDSSSGGSSDHQPNSVSARPRGESPVGAAPVGKERVRGEPWRPGSHGDGRRRHGPPSLARGRLWARLPRRGERAQIHRDGDSALRAAVPAAGCDARHRLAEPLRDVPAQTLAHAGSLYTTGRAAFAELSGVRAGRCERAERVVSVKFFLPERRCFQRGDGDRSHSQMMGAGRGWRMGGPQEQNALCHMTSDPTTASVWES